LFSTHIHTNNIGNVTKQTSHRTTRKKDIEQHKKCIEQHKKYIEQQQKKLGRVRAVPRLCGHHPGICLTTEEKAGENLSQGVFGFTRKVTGSGYFIVT
jgi:N-dimethylarginine dimethylaminohydrolase